MKQLWHLIQFALAYLIFKPKKLSYAPYQYTIEPTNVCNLTCDFCPQSDPEHHKLRPKGRLDIGKFKAFIQSIKDAGGSTIAEDQSTCVVFGMPKAAIELGCVDEVVPLPQIAQTILKMI